MKILNKHGGVNSHTGRGSDRMGRKGKDGLRFDWKWLQIRELAQCPQSDRRRVPCQTCRAQVGTITTYMGNDEFDSEIVIEAVSWHRGYEGVLHIGNNHHVAGTPFKATRVEAQRAAEQLLCGLAEDLLNNWGEVQ